MIRWTDRNGVGLFLVAAIWLNGSAAVAGPHENGVFVPHLNPELEYTTSIRSYEGQSDLRDCELASVNGRADSEQAQVWFVLASFHDSPGPVELAGAAFGFGNYDTSRLQFVDYGACNDGYLELSTSGWPGPEEGTAILFPDDFPVRDELAEIYWFACYVYDPVSIELTDNPGTPDGAEFTTPGATYDPAIEDEAWDYGIISFGGDDAYNPCSFVAARGACCLYGEECYLLTHDDCGMQGGEYQGDHTDCFPNPCREDPHIATSWGVLKRLYE